jgi:hypothetical protein
VTVTASPAAQVSTRPRLPNLLVIGAMRAGSSSTWTYLRGHPDVFMSQTKELHFFDRDENWSRGADWYRAWFADAGDAQVVGEATPAYTRFPQVRDVPERAAGLMPGAKLLYVVRDPAERIRSHYQHAVSHGEERLPFLKAVTTRSTYVDTSRYAMQAERWLEHFPRERLLVLQSERLRSDRSAALKEVFAFLGIDPDPPGLRLPDTERNRSAGATRRHPAVVRARQTRPGQVVKRLVPTRVARLARSSGLLDVPVDRGDAVVTPELREVLRPLLRADVRALRAYLPPSFDGWGMDR